jgi:hypothetical protein
MTENPADSMPIAWRALVYGTPIASADGQVVGELREVLGSDADDVFHGLRVRLTSESRDVLLASEHTTLLTASQVQTDLPAAEFAKLPNYAEETTYHLASVGWLRKHVGWVKDSEKDEEPG